MVKMGVMGRSGHVNVADYREGVLIGNWYENTENHFATAKGEHILGLGAPFVGEAATAAAQATQGRTGGELSASYARTDLTRVGNCVPAALKFSHSDPFEPPVEYFATVNQLAYGEKCLGEPPVQQYLWSAKAKHNAQVPISSLEGSSTHLGETKRSQWRQQTANDMYTTTTQAVLNNAVLQAAAAPPGSTKPARAAPGSQEGPAPTGRKAVGTFANELDKNYHLIGLRK